MYDLTDFGSLARSLPEMRQLLEEMEKKVQIELGKSVSQQIKIQKMKDEIRELKNRIAKQESYEAQEPESDYWISLLLTAAVIED